MSIQTKTSTLAIVAASVAGPVTAQGLGGHFYAGGGLDYGLFKFETEQAVFTNEFDNDGDAAGLALIAGYRIDSGNIFYGAEADVTWMFSSSIDVPESRGSGEVECVNNQIGPCDVRWTSHIRGIAGYSTGSVDIFGAAGAAIHNVEFARFRDGPDAETVFGASIGAGVQFPLGSFDTRVEVLHDFALETEWEAEGGDYTTEWSATSVRAAAIFRF